jgi:hypothetical protein
MALPDISNLSLTELAEVAKQVILAYKAGLATQKTNIAQVAAEVDSGIVELTALLGETDGTPDIESIRGVLQFTDQDMVDNAGLAFRLAFQGLEAVTATTLNLAYLVSKLAHNLEQ